MISDKNLKPWKEILLFNMNSKLRICFVGWADSIHTKRYVEWFAMRGYDVHLITDRRGYNFRNVTIHFIKNDNNSTSRFKRYLSLDFNDRRWQKHVFPYILVNRIIKRICPDLLHLHTLYFPSRWAVFSRHKPLVIMPWNGDIIWKANDSIFHKLVIRHALRKASAILYNSREMHKLCKNIAGESKEYRNRVGVSLSMFKPGICIGDLRQRLNICAHDKVILSTRSLGGFYNIKVVLKAAATVVEKYGNVKLVLCWHSGEENQVSELRRRAEQLGIKRNVVFYGHISYEEMPMLYNLADVAISLSSKDSCPMSMLEAMACGTPIVMGDLPQIREWIKNDKNGYIVPCIDEKAAAAAIMRILSNEQIAGSFIKNNIKLVNENADFDKNMKNIEDLYYRLVRRRK